MSSEHGALVGAVSAAVGVCDVPAVKAVCTTAGAGAGSLVAAPITYLAASAGGAAKWMFEGVWSVFDATTVVDVGRPGFVAVYNLLFGVAIFVMLLFFLLQLITGLLRRDPGALGRAVVGLGKAVVGSFLVVTVTAALLTIVDDLSIGVVQATGSSMAQLGAKIATLGVGLTTLDVGSPGVGAIITLFLSGLAITGTALLWFSLLVRKALLLVLIVLAPIALSGAVWDATRGWAGRWAATVIALSVSKLVVVVVFLVATAQLASPIEFDLRSISGPVTGIVLMFVAAFAPYMCYRFVSFIGFDLYHAISAEQEVKQAVDRPVPLPVRPSSGSLRTILDGFGGSPTGGSGAGPTPPPTRPSGETAKAAAAATPTSATTGSAMSGGSAASVAGPAGLAVAGAAAAGSAATGATSRAVRATRGAVAEQVASTSSSSAQGQAPQPPRFTHGPRPTPPPVVPPRPQEGR